MWSGFSTTTKPQPGAGKEQQYSFVSGRWMMQKGTAPSGTPCASELWKTCSANGRIVPNARNGFDERGIITAARGLKPLALQPPTRTVPLLTDAHLEHASDKDLLDSVALAA